jgi:hypothetical protein
MSLAVSREMQECSRSIKKKSKPDCANKRAMPGLRISDTIGPKTTFPSCRARFMLFLKITVIALLRSDFKTPSPR